MFEQNGHPSPVLNGSIDTLDREIHSHLNKLNVEFQNFYGIQPTRVDRRFPVNLSDLTYLPKVDDPRADWVVTAAFNAFRAFQSGELGVVERFATVGTGAGTDVVAALEIFPHLHSVALTDLHDDVVNTAKKNVLSATEKAENGLRAVAMQAIARAGDVLLPLKGQNPFDLIYENLPNIPLPDVGNLTNGQTSSTYIGDRSTDKVPQHVSANLLDLHYVCLRQARDLHLLNPSGVILSSMGGRVPLEAMLNMADSAGYVGRVLGLSWKAQSEPEAVIGGYAEHQARGLGPFYFYPVAALESVFKNRTFAAAGLCASQIEDELLPHRLDAEIAFQRHHAGIRIGHTVVVVASVAKHIY